MSEKQVNELFALFADEYKAKHGSAPDFNRYREKWGFKDMISDLGIAEAREVVKYFFKTGGEHSTARLFNSYEALRKQKDKVEKDQARIEEVMKATAKRVNDWKAKHGTN